MGNVPVRAKELTTAYKLAEVLGEGGYGVVRRAFRIEDVRFLFVETQYLLFISKRRMHGTAEERICRQDHHQVKLICTCYSCAANRIWHLGEGKFPRPRYVSCVFV
jgi:hypothetical protein